MAATPPLLAKPNASQGYRHFKSVVSFQCSHVKSKQVNIYLRNDECNIV